MIPLQCVLYLHELVHAYLLSLFLIINIVMRFNLLEFPRNLTVVVPLVVSFFRTVDFDVDVAHLARRQTMSSSLYFDVNNELMTVYNIIWKEMIVN